MILIGHNYPIFCLKALPNGLLASGSSDGTIKFWQVSSAKQATIERSIDTGSQIEALLII